MSCARYTYMRSATACYVIASFVLATLVVTGCAGATDSVDPDTGDPTAEGDVSAEALSSRTFHNATVLYQGDWHFLTSCDKWSKGRVRFACDESPSRDFVDEGLWVAAPSTVYSRGLCSKQVKLCKRDTCVTAKLVERSVTSGKWEGSSAVLEALGVDHGAPSCTRSWGTATGVTVTIQ